MRGLRIMNKQYKKILSVLFAILVGAGIIFFAIRGGNTANTETALDGNSWKDSLSVVPQTNALKTLSASQGSVAVGDATTTADIVARELLTNYALAQKNNMSTTTLSDADAIAIAQTAVSKINIPEAKQFTANDINISNDNSSSSVATYMKEIGALTQAFTLSQTKNDIEVAFAIPKAGDNIKRLADIAQNIAHYEKLIGGLLAVKTPSLISSLHVRLLQKYANIQANIKPMADIFTDPLKGLAALAQYRREVAEFGILANEYNSYLPKSQQ